LAYIGLNLITSIIKLKKKNLIGLISLYKTFILFYPKKKKLLFYSLEQTEIFV